MSCPPLADFIICGYYSIIFLSLKFSLFFKVLLSSMNNCVQYYPRTSATASLYVSGAPSSSSSHFFGMCYFCPLCRLFIFLCSQFHFCDGLMGMSKLQGYVDGVCTLCLQWSSCYPCKIESFATLISFTQSIFDHYVSKLLITVCISNFGIAVLTDYCEVFLWYAWNNFFNCSYSVYFVSCLRSAWGIYLYDVHLHC